MAGLKIITRCVYVAWPEGVQLLADLKIKRSCVGSWDGDGECVAVEVCSALYPSGLPVADAEVLCGLLSESGVCFEVKDSLVGECSRMSDYPGLAWDKALPGSFDR